MNAGDALECVLAGQRKTLEAVARQISRRLSETTEDSGNQPVESPPSRARREKAKRREHRLEQYQRVIELSCTGRSKLAIAKETRLDVQTVRIYLTTNSFPERAQRRNSLQSIHISIIFLMGRRMSECDDAVA